MRCSETVSSDLRKYIGMVNDEWNHEISCQRGHQNVITQRMSRQSIVVVTTILGNAKTKCDRQMGQMDQATAQTIELPSCATQMIFCCVV